MAPSVCESVSLSVCPLHAGIAQGNHFTLYMNWPGGSLKNLVDKKSRSPLDLLLWRKKGHGQRFLVNTITEEQIKLVSSNLVKILTIQ